MTDPIQMIVNLTPRAHEAMYTAAEGTKQPLTDIVCHALMVYEAIATAQPGDELRLNLGGRTVRVQLPDGGAA